MWFVRFLTSSIGKKWIMAVSGLLLLLFLFSHIAGNTTLYLGSAAFQRYADRLHSHMLLLNIFRIGLFLLFLVHISTGLFLFYQNRKARPIPYRICVRSAAGRSSAGAIPVASDTKASMPCVPYFRSKKASLPVTTPIMPYSGLATLLFIVIHIFGFSLSPQETPIATTVVTLLRIPGYGLFYILSFTVVAMHLHHGFWSLFQTLGLSHPRFMLLTARLTFIIPLFFLLAAGGIPLLLICGVQL